VEEGFVKIVFVRSEDNISDPFTKNEVVPTQNLPLVRQDLGYEHCAQACTAHSS